MAKFQIQLNGSNIVSKDRLQAFQDALVDDHRVDCGDGPQLKVSVNGKSRQSLPAKEQAQVQQPAASQADPTNLGKALDHTYAHQSRTMEIHQQYLVQQGEYIKLITAVLDQQGKVLLDNGNGDTSADIIKTFQRTLDNFHSIRKQGLLVHQEFLARQAEFSDRYLTALEGGNYLTQKAITPAPPESQVSAPSEWVVQEPPIVLDEQIPEPEKPLAEVPEPREQPSSGKSSVTAEQLSGALLKIVAEKTGYPSEMLELDMDLEADLGIDSIKRVEILGSLEEEFPSLPAADTEVLAQTRTLQEIVDYMNSEAGDSNSASQPEEERSSQQVENSGSDQVQETPSPAKQIDVNGSAPTVSELTSILLDIVAAKTGYPAEMLEADMDMEADLGIDSIKRVEILGAMEEKFPGLPAVEADALAELRTLGQIVELMSTKQTTETETESIESEDQKNVVQVELKNTPVKLVSLPAPDELEFIISKDRPVIVTDEGTALTVEIVKALSEDGWKVVLWDFPANLINKEKRKLPKGIKVVLQHEVGKKAIDAAIDSIRSEHGSPGGFIHLHPQPADNGLFSDRENLLVKQVFLIAGSIKPDLNQVDPASRRIFMAVTRTDGSLGIKNSQSFQEGSGLPGLVKTLNWEWPEVFCRTVDIKQDTDFPDASKLLIKEIHDPDQGLIEVGISTTSRVTIKRDNG
jgi:acyl carrier protein